MIIRNCKQEEIPQLIDFLRNYWKTEHVLVKHPEMLIWQYENEEKGLNFLIAKNQDDIQEEILAILGYIPLSRFDNELSHHKECWGAIWKVSPNCKIPGLGTFMQKKICNLYNFYGGLSLSMDSIRIQKTLSHEIVPVNQYFIVNPKILNFQIAKIPQDFTPIPIVKNSNFELEQITELASCQLEHSYWPMKSINFLVNRYQNHPWYKYEFLGCIIGSRLECIMVLRRIKIGERYVIRIVDVYGSLSNLKGLAFRLTKYLSEQPNTEYIDICNYGINPSFFVENGFNRLDVNSDNVIIPNYFEPFLKKNIFIGGVIHSQTDKQYTFFKADADQDRPNIL